MSIEEEKSRRLIQIFNRLEDEGAGKDIDIPTAILIGTGSRGKYQLLEGLSGISLPDYEGNSAPCPIELRLFKSDDDTWTCDIFLILKYDTRGNELHIPSKVAFQTDILDEELADVCIRRAQKALLNPNRDYSFYRTYAFEDSQKEHGSGEPANEISFTLNTLSIVISGARTNFTILDFPYSCPRVGKHKDGDKTMLQETTQALISKPRVLVIASFSCKLFENQPIFDLLWGSDPQGERTIGVIQKLECSGENYLEARRHLSELHPLKMGYYIVDPYLEETNSEATYFSCDRSSTRDSDRSVKDSVLLTKEVGFDGIAEILTDRLTELIESNLVDICVSVSALTEETCREIEELPELLDQDPRLGLFKMIKAFSDKIKTELIDSESQDGLSGYLEIHVSKFIEELSMSQPKLILPKEKNIVSPYVTHSSGPQLSNHFTIDKLLGMTGHNSNKDFPRSMKSDPIRDIVLACQKNWGECAQACLLKIKDEVRNLLEAETKASFGRFMTLYWKVRTKMDKLVRRNFETSKKMLQYLFRIEQDRLVTSNMNLLTERLDGISRHLEEVLAEEDASSNPDAYDQTSVARESRPNATLIRGFANCAAYYNLSQSRFGDMVGMSIYRSFILDLVSDLELFLIEELGIIQCTPKQASFFTAEGTSLAAKRLTLNSRLARLERVQEILFLI